jgi:hypothetical protein
MPLRTGTYSIADLRRNRQTTAAEFGLDAINETLQADMQVHEDLINAAISELADISDDRLRLAGQSDSGEMQKVDEFGRAAAQKVAPGATVGFPLELFQFPIAWTQKFLDQAFPADIAQSQLDSQAAHARAIMRELKRAIYRSANYTFRDSLVAPVVDLGIKRFANADGMPIPNGPNGEVFDGSTHQHYIANATLTAAFATTLINTVAEHTNNGAVRVAIAQADEAAWRALAGFVAVTDVRLTQNANTNEPIQRLNVQRLNNRLIGYFGVAEVWVKPWAIPNYAFAHDLGVGAKPIVVRTRRGQRVVLATAAENRLFPLLAKFMESEFGIGVWVRTRGAVLQHNAGSYTDPTIN